MSFFNGPISVPRDGSIRLLDDTKTLALKDAKTISISWTKVNTGDTQQTINLIPEKITIDNNDHLLNSPDSSNSSNILDNYKLQITQNNSKGGGNFKRYYGTPLKKTRYAKRKSANRRKRAKTARLFSE